MTQSSVTFNCAEALEVPELADQDNLAYYDALPLAIYLWPLRVHG